jgi:hypothetical protein
MKIGDDCLVASPELRHTRTTGKKSREIDQGGAAAVMSAFSRQG